MLLIKLYFTPALLLLVFGCSVWQVGQSLPVMEKGPATDSCVLYAQSLLHNITDVLTQSKLFSGIECAKQNMELNTETNTPSVCTPQGSSCSESTQLQFDQESCVTNIGKDLRHYYKFLTAQPDPESLLGPTVLLSLRELMENCFKGYLPTDLALQETAADRASTYAERLSLCKVLRGFQVRTITINRVIGYMNSGE
ncbi:interleukin-12 subunit alpha [Melanotaenia boesemani]|uniref:interleukin-12 subunit alpha n=1 Tax=Melanotaenia boesemani TaxID=1250792 RepID=UPI001C057140|nr:interleukin-12 subunit alpha [Melanotaenia boesemani]